MQLTNRIHPASRWPADPQERYDLAITDVCFCGVMERIMGYDDRLREIAARGLRVGKDARREIEFKKGKAQ